jgi:hypothetical protein
MTIARRVLDAVTPRRVLAALLIGGFTKEILSFISWLVGTGWALTSAASVRACLLSGLSLAVDVALIYLALRGLDSVLEHRRRAREALAAPPGGSEQDPTLLEDLEAARRDAATWPREGGGDGRDPDYY